MASPQAAPALERVTTRYCHEQDRVRLAGELPGGDPVLLWLTQRLLRRLLRTLTVWLESHPEHAAAGFSAPLGAAQALYADTVQGFAQQAARAGIVRQLPVQVSGDSPACLVHSVEIAATPQILRLVFCDAQRAVAGMELQARPLRQWLDILYEAWRQAEWPLECWPLWMHKEASRLAPQTGALVH